MIKKVLFLLTFLLMKWSFSQKTEPIYYDGDWKITNKDKALFYRQTPIKELGEMILLQDFYINGTPQFEGYTFKHNENKYVGDIVWYDENGNDTTLRNHPNSTKNSTLTYYHLNGKVRKTIQYKNGLKDSETVYHPDGTILMKGFFVDGKPDKGEFDNVRNDYESESEDEEVVTTTALAPPPPIVKGVETGEYTNSPDGKQITVTEKIFWANSKQLAQETLYRMGMYDFRPVQQKNYDQSGKLLQILTQNHFETYGDDLENGTDYDYYLQNRFATGLKSITKIVDGRKSGKEMTYHPNGKIAAETLYKKGYKDGEELVYSEDGTIKSKRTYKEEQPFTGNFEMQEGEIIINLNYLNGEKEGDAVAKDENNEIVAKGIYKNGKPFNGTFIINNENDDVLSLINVENFKKTGLQKDFNYRLSSLVKTYTIQNEKLNGRTTFYSEDKPIATLEYKNDEPFEGILIAGNTVSIFKNGKKTTETTYNQEFNEKSDDQIANQKIFENGILTKVRNSTFHITEKPETVYEGIYKNGKPFSGYFETEEDREFKQVDYYENGEKKFQYSNDYLENMDNYRFQEYNIKSTYKNGKIFDGVEYILRDKQFVSRYFRNGVLTSFNWDLFAMHYFNRIHFELKGNTIEMNDMQEKATANIVIDPNEKNFSKKLMIDGKVVQSKVFNDAKSKSPTVTLYYLIDQKLTSESIETLDFEEEPPRNSEFIFKVYLTINPKMGNLQEIFNNISENIGTENWIDQVEGKNILTGIRINAEGKPQDGMLITENNDKSYSIQYYSEGKMTKQAQGVSIKNLEKEVEKLERLR